ncbi:hypothetical protein DFJ73DRAFT_778869 [Zopfochytrium polystomum]|nr:hypothetical protein DFJ73DRAFT_778869 [Zopfochytrium polystomum]
MRFSLFALVALFCLLFASFAAVEAAPVDAAALDRRGFKEKIGGIGRGMKRFGQKAFGAGKGLFNKIKGKFGGRGGGGGGAAPAVEAPAEAPAE